MFDVRQLCYSFIGMKLSMPGHGFDVIVMSMYSSTFLHKGLLRGYLREDRVYSQTCLGAFGLQVADISHYSETLCTVDEAR